MSRQSPNSPDRVIIIDDSQQSLWVLEALLIRAGFQVCALNDTQAVFSRVLAERPDAILCDVRMPGLGGPALMSLLRRVEHGRRTPVLLYSALPEQELAALAEQCGADGFIPKNTPDARLVAAIRSAISLSRGAAPQTLEKTR